MLAWPKAVYALGLRKERLGDYSGAILYFQDVIGSHPNASRTYVSQDVMEDYRNYSNYSAIQISACYERLENYRSALYWAWLARFRYRYVSWCSTCEKQAVSRTNKRIASLSAQVAAPYSLAFLLAGGLALAWNWSKNCEPL